MNFISFIEKILQQLLNSKAKLKEKMVMRNELM